MDFLQQPLVPAQTHSQRAAFGAVVGAVVDAVAGAGRAVVVLVVAVVANLLTVAHRSGTRWFRQ